MRTELLILTLLSVSLMGRIAFSQTTSDRAAPAAPMIQSAALPTYPPIARAAHVTGKITVRVTVKDGSVVRTDVLSKPNLAGRRFLQTPTLENLKTWHFAADVNGHFTVTYTYNIAGNETDRPTNPRVEILPSLDVNVTAHPVKPTVMYGMRDTTTSTRSSPAKNGMRRRDWISFRPDTTTRRKEGSRRLIPLVARC